MPKPNKNDYKNGKQTNLLVQGARSAAQKSQITIDTENALQTTKSISSIRVT